MQDRKPNQRAGDCALCGKPVAAGAGYLAGRTTRDDGSPAWRVEHCDCEPSHSGEVPVWACYIDREVITSGGLTAPRGACVISGPLADNADPTIHVPLNDAAKALHSAMPAGPMRTSMEWRAIILARYGQTERVMAR